MRFVITTALMLVFCFSISAQETAKTQIKEFTLRVEAEKNLDLKMSDLAKLPRQKLSVKNKGTTENYEGVWLRDVLLLANAKISKNQLRGAEMKKFLLVEAADNYQAIFALAEIDEEFAPDNILLADARDGKPLSENDGRLKIIVPGDKKPGRWVRQVVALKIKIVE